VGYDTAVRICDKKYYGSSQEEMLKELQKMILGNVKIVVAGREVNGVFHSGAEFKPPEELSALFEPLGDFRYDISSTEIRASGGKPARL
jgi:hypothetical protein